MYAYPPDWLDVSYLDLASLLFVGGCAISLVTLHGRQRVAAVAVCVAGLLVALVAADPAERAVIVRVLSRGF